MTQPSLSIVIPTLNAGPMLVKCVEQLDLDRESVDLVVIDNGSSDGSVDALAERYPRAHVIRHDHNAGYAPACNQGAGATTSEFILFLNNDVIVSQSDVDILLAHAKADERGAVWQPILYDDDGSVDFSGDLFSWTGFLVHLDDVPSQPRRLFAVKGACMLVRRTAFEAVGGFTDDYFAYFEEADLCWRLRLAGWEVSLVPQARATHAGGATTSRLFSPADIRYLSARNRLTSILANAGGRTLALVVPLHVLGSLGFAVLYVVTGRPASAAATFAALVWPIRHRATVRAHRARAQAIRRRTDSEVMERQVRGRFSPSVLVRHLREQMYRWERTRSAPRRS